ncbi:hypothetical protein Vadar_003673 [Vaccinium darrowii]|uniref:Uncharacterized protein n=1 Tax=Vaccinium darrowii TaxID=229202 RepID=A0ACB7ZH22_9ERIC|nr:hypothetical protein Vadar_003673 [Vaccinium darrowii]
MTLRDVTDQQAALTQRVNTLETNLTSTQKNVSTLQETMHDLQTFATNIESNIAAFKKTLSQVYIDVDAQIRRQQAEFHKEFRLEVASLITQQVTQLVEQSFAQWDKHIGKRPTEEAQVQSHVSQLSGYPLVTGPHHKPGHVGSSTVTNVGLSPNMPPLQVHHLEQGGLFPPERYSLSRHVPYDSDDITRRVKVDTPSFDGSLDPSVFIDWLHSLEDYFDWCGMTDEKKVLFAKMKLVGSAKVYLQGVQRDQTLLGEAQFTRWDDMRLKLKEKYLPTSHRKQLMNQWLNLKQGSLSVGDYIAQFEVLMLRCEVHEEPWIRITRFINGLRSDYHKDINMHLPQTLEDAYRLARDLEGYSRFPTQRRTTSQVGESYQSRNFERAKGGVPYQSQGVPSNQTKGSSHPNHSAPVTSRGSYNPSQTVQQFPNSSTRNREPTSSNYRTIECYNCHGLGHTAARCPLRTLIVGNDEDDPQGEGGAPHVVEPLDPCDSEEECEELDVDTSLHVMRCIVNTFADTETWKRTNIFHTYVQSGDKVCKLVIDGGSSMNVVSKAAVNRLKLKPELHPQPYRVAWVDKTSLPVSERCLVPIQMGCYSDNILCDVLPMDVAHVLLGRPWLYDVDAKNFGRENTYVFQHGGNKVLLKPAKPIEKDNMSRAKRSYQVPSKHKLHLLTRREFERESQESHIILAVVYKGDIEFPIGSLGSGTRSSVSRWAHESVAVSKAAELFKLIFLSTSTAPEVPNLLAETLRRYSEHDLFAAFNYLREKKIMVGGSGGNPFILSQQFLQTISSSPFPTNTGNLQCGDVFHLCALLSSGEWLISPCLPDDGVGEAEDSKTLKRKFDISGVCSGDGAKKLKSSSAGEGEVISR